MKQTHETPLKSPYHPSYGLPDLYRLRALAHADTVGMRQAANDFRISTSTLYCWKRDFLASRVLSRQRSPGHE